MIIEQNTMPVVIGNDYKRMEQKLSVFIRGIWDPEMIPFCKIFEESHYNLKPAGEVKGFTQLERALKTAAWSVCQEYTPSNEYGCANTGLYVWDGEVNPDRLTPADEREASLIVKNAAKFFGASLVGIADYDLRWVYSSWYDFSQNDSVPAEFPFKVKSVVVAAIAMDYSAYRTSPSLVSFAATGLGYSRMAEIGKKLATFIRILGYNAIPSGNDSALNIPIAVQAGLGEVGRNGLLITPQFGPRVRLVKIFTDMPLQADRPITFGVSQFCIKCKKCAESCPASAIPAEAKPTMKGTSISNCSGVLKWYTDPERCFRFWASNGGECGNCIACCPYNKWSSWHHDLARRLTESVGGNRFIGPNAEMRQPSEDLVNVKVNQALGEACQAIPVQDYYRWDVEPDRNKKRFKDSETASLLVKKAARFLGADLVGIAEYDEKWISAKLNYSQEEGRGSCVFPFSPKSVVVMAIEINYDNIRPESSIITKAAINLGYSRMAETVKKVATFIRQLGYRAIPCGDDSGSSIPLAIKAGLGEYGRNGLLVTKKYGPRVQLFKIFTELELKPDKPVDFGVADTCATCKNCIECCPAQAISYTSDGSGVERGSVDPEKCAGYWDSRVIDCCECITSCPYNNPNNRENDFSRITADLPLASATQRQKAAGEVDKALGQLVKDWWKLD